MDFLSLSIYFLAVVVCITVHEFCHALAAYYFGDHTAKDMGRLTLNPFSHIDLFGTIFLPLALLIVGLPPFGWAKPVPVNFSNLRNRRFSTAIVALAGPVSNLILVGVFGLVYLWFFSAGQMSGTALPVFITILILANASLFTFNLLPIPPLDGSKVFLTLIPDKFYEFKDKYELYGPYLLVILLILDNFLPILQYLALGQSWVLKLLFKIIGLG